MNQASLISLLFTLLWHKPETFYHTCPHFSYLSLCFFLFCIYTSNESAIIPLCGFWLYSIPNSLFTYFMYHLLYIISEAHYISWKSMYTIYFWCCCNVCFFVLEKECFFPNLFLITVFTITPQTNLFFILPTTMIYHRWFREEHFIGRNITFRAHQIVDLGTPNSSRRSE